MLYLAEVKVQNRGFVGGYKTELKLLASQAIDQTWNTVAGEEIVSTDAISDQTGKGTLYIVNLDNNKQLQGTPELAGTRVVNYLRHFSRTLEKSKSQEEEIEEWKTSLRLQGEEISRRQAEIDEQEQILQQQKQEFAKLEEEKNKLHGAWEQLRLEQQKVNENQANQGEIKGKLQNLLEVVGDTSFNPENLDQALSGVKTQQNLLDDYWQQLESQKASLNQKQQEFDHKKHHFEQRRQELEFLEQNLQKAISGLQSDEILLQQKEESLKQLNLYLESFTRLDIEISLLNDDSDDIEIDFNALETMSLGDLEQRVNNLQQETAKLVNFVNLQEEELTLQSDEVKNIQIKLIQANEFDKFAIESELAEAQEAMKMLNKTLVGQRVNLKKQQKMLNQHLKIFSRRKGIIDLDFADTINLRPVLDEVETQLTLLEQQRDKLHGEINHLRHSNSQIEQTINHEKQKYQQQQVQLKEEEENWLQSYQDFTKTQIQISLLEQALHPIQEQLNHIRNNLQALEQSTQKFNYVFNELQSIF
ncbi:pilus motility taxis protein HmpF [Geminocystis sp. GBBB08]|uniref:pilus motility taxis protein HmpF n=1 Tax=Geminocystis sp. GBBB08 TaxID=2604140 RepID=UPI0027E3A957|nr:pilus motility taxis protein HmpF [Geminocystis sp. GBBB08]MBL1210540.1 hypothetical protein [Geminocystis sp. GBBB08]